MNKDVLISRGTRTISSLLFCWLYIPHLIVYLVMHLSSKGEYIDSDISTYIGRKNIIIRLFSLIFLLHNNRQFRSVFYFRIGPFLHWLIGWYRPGDYTFQISDNIKIGKFFHEEHAYCTIINAESIGDYCNCLHGVTIGKKNGQRPIIGDHVSICAHAQIVGGVKIGNNVIIGAGAVVVKDVPDNSIVAGNPAKVIKKNE